MVDLARALKSKPTVPPPTFHFGVVDSVQSASVTLSQLDGVSLTRAGVSWIVEPAAGQTVLLLGFDGRLLVIGPVSAP